MLKSNTAGAGGGGESARVYQGSSDCSQQAPRCQHPRDLGFNRLLHWTPLRRPLASAHNKPHSSTAAAPGPRAGTPGSAGLHGSSRLSAVRSSETLSCRAEGSPAWLLPGRENAAGPPRLCRPRAVGGSQASTVTPEERTGSPLLTCREGLGTLV